MFSTLPYLLILFAGFIIVFVKLFNFILRRILYQPPLCEDVVDSPQVFIKGSGMKTVFVFHGNATNLNEMLWFRETHLAKLNCNIVLLTYPGYCGEYEPINQTVIIRSCTQQIQQVFDTHEKIDQNKVVFYGISLGGAVAIQLAQIFRPNQLIIENTFTRLSDVICHHTRLPMILSPLIETILYDPWPSVDTLRQLFCDVLVISSENDKLIPPWMSETLSKASKSINNKLIKIPRANHNTTWLRGEEVILDAIRKFIEFPNSSNETINGNLTENLVSNN